MNSTVQLLAEMRNGRVADQLHAAACQATDSIRGREGGKPVKSTVTLKLTFAPDPRFGDAVIRVTAQVDSKLPSEDVVEAIMYAGEGGELLRQDPRQGDVEQYIREVKAGA